MNCTTIQDICITKGDSKDYLLTFTDKDNQPVDITGATVYFTCKNKLNDNDISALFSKKVTIHHSPADGKTIISLTHIDTDIDVGGYFYDIQLTLADKVHTVMKGIFRVTYEVTEAV